TPAHCVASAEDVFRLSGNAPIRKRFASSTSFAVGPCSWNVLIVASDRSTVSPTVAFFVNVDRKNAPLSRPKSKLVLAEYVRPPFERTASSRRELKPPPP